MTKLGVRAIIEHNGLLLAVKNVVSQGDFYCLPGGGVETGENLYEALERELIEELGVKPVIGNLVYVHQMANFNNSGERYGMPGLYFHVENSADYFDANFSKASHAHELHIAEFVDPCAVTLKPTEIADDWENLMQNKFNIPAKILIGEWNL